VSDPDDWFGGAAADERTAGDVGDRTGEDWLHDVDRTPGRPWHETVDRRLVVVGVVFIGLLIAVLAAAGVFSGGGHKAAPPPVPVTTVASTPTTPAPKPTPLPSPTAPLKPGDTGAQVKVLQRALTSLGYSTGKVDGDYGPGTEAAVKQFQTAKGLTADGVAGSATLRALKSALRSHV
jgi:Putative peptidoglycan binding domain